MTPSEKKLIEECIKSHYRMIKYHRKAIVELERKALEEQEFCMECLDMEIISEGR